MTADTVYNGSVRPVWIGTTNNFLYENMIAAGTEFLIIVDAEKLIKRKAFNHYRFAKSLVREAGKFFEYVLLFGSGQTSGGVCGERKRRDFFVKNLLRPDPSDWNMLEE